ncbi:uncharacterized protein LOC133192371 [Saccostrea echinata]|uniref:uncharacterized protein LOC133192371 n=1 Tax=Saccostrea echinata TaxID=191078 RepID=UPI002A8130DA|nr:uncharacterized protein LOC133192371 [Saccostrea echinata]
MDARSGSFDFDKAIESWTVEKFKKELISRGATTKGRKADLIERLRAYDRNRKFESDPILIPTPLEVSWPSKGFQQLTEIHREVIPQLCLEQIDLYFVHRLAGDKQCSGDVKAIEKGRNLVESRRIQAVSFLFEEGDMCLSGIVGASMKNKVSYTFKLKLDKVTGDILNSHCECPAGRGPHGTCKHVAAFALMLSKFVSGEEMYIEKSCTENLQVFHKPRYSYNGSPVKAEELPMKRGLTEDIFEDPRPVKYRNSTGFPDRTRNLVFNYCSMTSENLTYRYLHSKADMQTATLDHDYLEKPITEYWIDSALQVTEREAAAIEERTRGQSSSKSWFEERKWRLTSSRFGDICLATHRRNKTKLCQSLISSSAVSFRHEATSHGRVYENKAISRFETKSGLKVKSCGLFVCVQKPYLGASPDGLVSDDSLIEVKCPYSGRHEKIFPGKHFSFLEFNSKGEIVLKHNSKYYFQIQGQLYISKRKYCYFVVFTFKDVFVQKIEIDQEYCEGSLLPKLELFYVQHFRPFLSSLL